MKYVLLFSIVFFKLNVFAQAKSEINFLALELHSEYYNETTYPKNTLKKYINSDSLFSRFPDQIKSYEFNPEKELIEFCKKCELKASKIKQNLNIKDSTILEKNLSICYAKYIQTSPELRFAFELSKSDAIYHINEVSVFIHHANIYLSADKDFFEHKKDEREKLFIDVSKQNQNQYIKLSQTHAVKDGGLALNLRCFTSKYWDGTYDKTKVLLHINFKFTNGQIIQSEPFIIEI